MALGIGMTTREIENKMKESSPNQCAALVCTVRNARCMYGCTTLNVYSTGWDNR